MNGWMNKEPYLPAYLPGSRTRDLGIVTRLDLIQLDFYWTSLSIADTLIHEKVVDYSNLQRA
jgi:hypothetical protein